VGVVNSLSEAYSDSEQHHRTQGAADDHSNDDHGQQPCNTTTLLCSHHHIRLINDLSTASITQHKTQKTYTMAMAV